MVPLVADTAAPIGIAVGEGATATVAEALGLTGCSVLRAGLAPPAITTIAVDGSHAAPRVARLRDGTGVITFAAVVGIGSQVDAVTAAGNGAGRDIGGNAVVGGAIEASTVRRRCCAAITGQGKHRGEYVGVGDSWRDTPHRRTCHLRSHGDVGLIHGLAI